MKGRKGELGTLATVIIFLLSVIVLALMASPVYDYFFAKSKTELCRASVVAAHTSSIAGQKFVNLECPASEVVLKKKDVYENGEYDEDLVKRAFAEEMRQCWWKMGEGKMEPFSEDILGSNKVCLICSEISLDGNLLKDMDDLTISAQDMEKYMNTTPMKNDKGGMTYSQYLSNDILFYQYQLFGWVYHTNTRNTLEPVEDINLEKENLVFFTYVTPNAVWNIPWLSAAVDKLSGSKQNALPTILSIPKEDFGKIGCDYVFK